MTLEQLQRELDATPFIAPLQIRAEPWDPDGDMLILSMPFQHALGGGAAEGHVHGGAIGALIDTAASMIFYAFGVKDAPTTSYHVDLVRPVVRSGMRAHTRIRRLGRTLGIADVDVFNDDGKLCAIGRATMAIRGGSAPGAGARAV